MRYQLHMLTYLPTAPAALIALHKRRLIRKEYATLERLLTDQRMKRPWRYIEKRISTRSQYMELWQEITYRLQESRGAKLGESRARKRARLERIAKQVRLLVAELVDGPLDLRVYEYFPPEVMEILGAPKWRPLDTHQRRSFADSLLREWPALPEILDQLEARALRLANEARSETRTVERSTRDRQTNYLFRTLNEYFRDKLGGPMHSCVAAIASTALGTAYDKDSVRAALRHYKGGA